MTLGRIQFDTVDWKDAAPGLRVKSVIRNGKQLRLLEITPEFVDVEWCERDHAGCVLEGRLEVMFEDCTEQLSAGDALFILRGERHRAKALSQSVKLVLVEDV
jgi:quercetin dioxygenase-like cupin family protein